MSKLLILGLLSSLALPAFAAKVCKVFGISDSPQGLTCSFPDRSVRLSCVEGKYYLDQSLVNSAFHLEVESGTVPMVFKAPGVGLTVVMNDPIEAELDLGKGELRGSCKR